MWLKLIYGHVNYIKTCFQIILFFKIKIAKKQNYAVMNLIGSNPNIVRFTMTIACHFHSLQVSFGPSISWLAALNRRERRFASNGRSSSKNVTRRSYDRDVTAHVRTPSRRGSGKRSFRPRMPSADWLKGRWGSHLNSGRVFLGYFGTW